MPKRKSTEQEKTTEQDWKTEWGPGYLYKDKDHVSGTHPAEKGEVTWQTVTLRGKRKSNKRPQK